ncbi:glycoside hydrolase family 3 N-terminal domain-containing protein [Streptomyces spiramenti]|uniref:Glycosyl hydrolase n=1 Tax=Streptomyces spiramenti TaxID=2720606 RepID=A0ABX1AQA0_9ACTN|nr:glycoside hydrolase family 3 N-terminal domain-containing protein [Streptomyces spiramenti]NJP66873.1 glycosyl hydrolase [Streptomyces spiramenti]
MTDPWQDTSLPAAERAADLLDRMTLDERLGQLVSIWPGSATGADGQEVAPSQRQLAQEIDDQGLLRHGLGQLTRPFGTQPVKADEGTAALRDAQLRIREANRFGVPAMAHEECLTGFTAWGATILPTPLAWGAAFDPELVEEAAALVGASLRSVGIHQGLAPVLDVTRDPRWGRTEETIGEDPYLVGTVGAAYVRGLESAGIVATLKHFAGYSGSRGARNHAPVAVGPRELAEVYLPPFETALREGGARSVMHAYNDLDGVPAAAHHGLLTQLLREEWGFTGTVVADYFGVSFLELSHGVADSPGRAGALALAAGVDVELPAVRCFGEALAELVRSGEVAEELVDRAALRVLTQKAELGLLDPDWSPEPPVLRQDPAGPGGGDGDSNGDGDPGYQGHGTPDRTPPVDLDPPELRDVARRLAEESVVLLADREGVLPLGRHRQIAVLGPLADDPAAMLGCYTFPRHVGTEHPGLPLGVEVPTLLQSLCRELPGSRFVHSTAVAAAGGGPISDAPNDSVDSPTTSVDLPGADTRPGAGTEAVFATVSGADLALVVVGDRSGLFGRGTSGEGCDVAELELPESQGEIIDAALAATEGPGIPVVLIVLGGRPYALGRWADRLAAVVQAFFPGQEGGPAVAGVLSGRVNPSGRLPVGVPRHRGGQPWGYLAAPLGQAGGASSLDPTPLYPFGHGLSYTTFAWEEASLEAPETATDTAVDVRMRVRNTGRRAGTEVVQLYLHDPVARVVRPVIRLVGYARVPLAAGESAEVRFRFHPDLASYPLGVTERIVEPGDLELRLAASSTDIRHTLPLRLTGEERHVGYDRTLVCPTEVRTD